MPDGDPSEQPLLANDEDLDAADVEVDGSPGQSNSNRLKHKNGHFNAPTRGQLRPYWLGLVVCMGGFLFGYDSGIVGGVLTLDSYRRDFRFTTDEITQISSLAVGLQQLGAFAACFAVWPVTHKLGRRYAIVLCSVIFIVGAVIQTFNTHSITTFLVGRFIAGLGLGGSSVVVPMYSSEMTPKEIRGQVGSFYQLMFTLGIFTSYWLDYAAAKLISSTQSRQWQLPIGLQILFAAALGIGTSTLKESTRWLTQKGRHEEAYASLVWIRANDGEEVQMEMEEIRNGVAFEAAAKEGFQLKELFQKDNANRTVTAAAVFLAQQATGATAFAYFGPQYFKLLMGDKENLDLLLTAVFGAVKVAACLLFVIFVADNIGRKAILTCGALFMAVCQLATAGVVRSHPAKEDGSVTGAGIATVVLIYLFVIGYNFSWGPLPWPYISEIFPARTREPGIAIAVAVAAQWLGNFIFSFTTPFMIETGWAAFLLWGVFDLAIASYSWFGLVETRGLSLEQIAAASDHGGRVKIIHNRRGAEA